MASHGNEPMSKKRVLIGLILASLGGFIMAVGLEVFIIPSNLMDGGIVGIAIMISHYTGLSNGLLIAVLNIPFLWVGYKQIGKTFTLIMGWGIVVLSVSTVALHSVHYTFNDQLLAIAFGGALLGVGVGISMKAGGCLDGTEVVALLLEQKLPLSVGQLVFGINAVIFGVASLVFTPEKAMYSLLTYLVAYIMIDLVQTGLSESKKFIIYTNNHKELVPEISERLGRTCTIFRGEGGYSGQEITAIHIVINRLEESKLLTIIKDCDSAAKLHSVGVHEYGTLRSQKKSIH